jgi:hypothetical protein
MMPGNRQSLRQYASLTSNVSQLSEYRKVEWSAYCLRLWPPLCRSGEIISDTSSPNDILDKRGGGGKFSSPSLMEKYHLVRRCLKLFVTHHRWVTAAPYLIPYTIHEWYTSDERVREANERVYMVSGKGQRKANTTLVPSIDGSPVYRWLTRVELLPISNILIVWKPPSRECERLTKEVLCW